MKLTRGKGLTYRGKPRTCGLRLSAGDVVVIGVTVVATVAAWPYVGPIVLLVPFVVGHFFLFCNVFRVARKPELVWAGVFVTNCACWVAAGRLGIWQVCVPQMAVTGLLILIEIRKPYYHGVFARQLNPMIDQYLDGDI